MTAKDSLANWLRHAHAMEGQAATLLEAQIDRLESYPEALPRLRQHLEETKRQQQLVEQCLSKLGENTSTLKDATMKVGASMQGMMHAMSGDEVLKHVLGNAAFEQFEAASYRSLVTAAQEAGEPEIARTCEAILQEEMAMAEWVWQRVPEMTEKYLRLEQTGAQAKR